MSTYTDLCNKVKETLNVDYYSRITPQKVNFVNPENTYCGTFSGKINATNENTIINGGNIANVVLSNSILDNVSFKNGMNIDTICTTIANISSELTSESKTREDSDILILNSLCSEISSTNLNLDIETIERRNSDENLSINLTERINSEREQTNAQYSDLNDKLDTEISNRIIADNILEKSVNDRMLHDRHLEMHLIDNREYPLLIKDFAINTYIDNNADAYVYINGNSEELPIGRIEKIVYKDSYIESFEFNAFANHPLTYELTAGGKFQYFFDKNTSQQYTGIGSYKLNCDLAQATSINDMQLVLDSANNNGYYNVFLKDDSTIPVAKLNANFSRNDENQINNCSLTITGAELSNIAFSTPYAFTSNGQSFAFRGKNGKQCLAILNNNTFVFFDEYTKKAYLPVKDARLNVFAKIYLEDIEKYQDDTLKEITITFEDEKRIKLNSENDFKSVFDISSPYKFIRYNKEDNTVEIKDELITYKYLLNNNAGVLIPGVANKKINENYLTLNVTLNFNSNIIANQINGVYSLTQTENPDIYKVEKTIDNFGLIKLTFNKENYKLYVDIKSTSTAADAICLSFSIENLTEPELIDNSQIIVNSTRICNDITNPLESETLITEVYAKKFELMPDLSKLERSGENKKLISLAKTEKKDILILEIPDKQKQIPNDYQSVASKFILNFKVSTNSLSDDTFTQLLIKSNHNEDKFYYTNKEVCKIYIKKNKWSTLQFEEIRPHRYIINDLDYSEIDFRLTKLKDKFIEHAVSASLELDKINNNLEFLNIADKDNVSYKGTLPFLSANTWTDQYQNIQYGQVKLSAFIAQLPNISISKTLKCGDMFRLSAAQSDNNIIYDADNIPMFLGEKDYFIINSPSVLLENIKWSDIDVFVNSESEVSSVYTDLVNQINITSSLISVKTDNLSSYTLSLTLSVDEISGYTTDLTQRVNIISSHASALTLSVDEISGYTTDLTQRVNIISSHTDALTLSVDEISSVVENNVISTLSNQAQILANDQDIQELSDKIDFILSVDKETVNYKGTTISYTPSHAHDYHNWQLSEYILGTLSITQQGQYPNIDLKQGDLFRVGENSAPLCALYDYRKDDNFSVVLNKKDYFIVNKNIEDINNILVDDIDIFRDAQVEVETITNYLENKISALTLSVDEISGYTTDLTISVDQISSHADALTLSVDEISGYTTDLTLSVNEISNYTTALTLSVNEISNYTTALTLSVDEISSVVENNVISTLSNQAQILANDQDIQELSNSLADTKYHYNKTFDEKFYTRGSTMPDLSVDVLNIIDSDETDNQYTLQFLSGTLVLIKK